MTKRAIIAKIRRRFARRLPLNITAVRRQDPALLDAAFAVTPFLGWRQALHAAGTDYRRINIELEELIECPICGIERASLIPHIMKIHGMTMDDFYAAHPRAPVRSEYLVSLAMNRSNAVRIRPHWEPVWSPEYVLDRLFHLHGEGYAIHYVYLEENESRLLSRAIEYFGHLDNAFVRLGFEPRELRIRTYWTPAEIERHVRGLIGSPDFPGMEHLTSILYEHHGGLYVACLREYGSVDRMAAALRISNQPVRRQPAKRRRG